MTQPAVLLFPEAVSPGPVTNIIGTAYTLTPADVGRFLRTLNASAVTVTLSAESGSTTYPDGASIWVEMGGDGPVTVAAGAGVTINSVGGSGLIAKYSVLQLKRTGINEWTAILASSGGGGASSFLQLSDTPSSYAGQALKAVRVNAGATALEFVDLSAAITSLQNLTMLGVNTTADTTNRLAVRALGMLLTAIYAADGGTGDVTLRINKEADTDVAVIDFQRSGMAFARIGLNGDNNFRVSVSADGATFIDSFIIDQATGSIDELHAEITIPSAATTDLGLVNTMKVAISGTTTITSFGTKPRRFRWIRFTGIMTLTYNVTTLILPGAANIVTAVGDTALFSSDVNGNWRCREYVRGNKGVDFLSVNGDTSIGLQNLNAGVAVNSPLMTSALQVRQLAAQTGLPSPTVTLEGEISAGVSVTGYGVSPAFGFKRVQGTIAAQTATGNAQNMGVFNGSSFDGTVSAITATFDFMTNEAQATGAHGSRERGRVTANGTTTLAEAGGWTSGGYTWGSATNFVITSNGVFLTKAYTSAWQVVTPVTGFSQTINDFIGALLLTPAGTLAAGTVTMPATPADGQQVQILSTQTVTAATVQGNTGQTMVGAPGTLAANTPYRFKYRGSSPTAGTWYPA